MRRRGRRTGREDKTHCWGSACTGQQAGARHQHNLTVCHRLDHLWYKVAACALAANAMEQLVRAADKGLVVPADDAEGEENGREGREGSPWGMLSKLCSAHGPPHPLLTSKCNICAVSSGVGKACGQMRHGSLSIFSKGMKRALGYSTAAALLEFCNSSTLLLGNTPPGTWPAKN